MTAVIDSRSAGWPNKAMHRMSGTHICWQFEWRWVPLIGDLDRWAHVNEEA